MPSHPVLRQLGTHPRTGREVLIKDGQYGPYVTDGEVNVTLNPTVRIDLDTSGAAPRAVTQSIDLVQAISLGHAVDLLDRKRSSRNGRYRRELGTDPITGRSVIVKDYGGSPFLADGELNVTLPDGTDRMTVSLEFASQLLRMRREGITACGECGEYGHNRRTCPVVKARDAKQHSRACKTCGQSGHTARSCASDLDLSDIDQLIDEAAAGGDITWRESKQWSGGEVYYRSRTVFQCLGRVGDLKRQKRFPEAAKLLIHLVAGEELGNSKDPRFPVSAAYQDLAIVLRRMKETDDEIQLLHRWSRLYPSDSDRFEGRLEKALARQAKQADSTTSKRSRGCGACGETGHNKQTCPTVAAGD